MQALPTLWLLGKSGAGKSSLIKALTGDSFIEIGRGFAPCTPYSKFYNFPKKEPLMRFLDSRGLGEANYDPLEDLKTAREASHLLLITIKLVDQEQEELFNALKILAKERFPFMVIYTAALQLSEKERKDRIHHFNELIRKILKPKEGVIWVEVDLYPESGKERDVYHYEALVDTLSRLLPEVALTLQGERSLKEEQQLYRKNRERIRGYAKKAAATDLLPIIGAVGVPAIQSKMILSLAKEYGLEYSKGLVKQFLATLGGAFALQYSLKLGARQLIKLIPAYGQTVGAATASALTYGTTIALGRAACFYLYRRSKGDRLSEEDLDALQNLYRDTFEKEKGA